MVRQRVHLRSRPSGSLLSEKLSTLTFIQSAECNIRRLVSSSRAVSGCAGEQRLQRRL